MGIMDILNNIDIKDIAMGLALASHGDNVVPNVVNIMDQRRKEQEKRDQESRSSEYINDAFKVLAGGEDPTIGLMQKQRQVNQMPDNINQTAFTGTEEQAMAGGGLTTEEVSNQAKAQASADYILEAQSIAKKMPHWADGVAFLENKYKGKSIDPQLRLSVLSTIYGKREAQILKGMELADKQMAREDTANEIISFDPTHRVVTRGGKVISEGTPKDEVTTDIKNAKRLVELNSKIAADPTNTALIEERDILKGLLTKKSENRPTLLGHEPKNNRPVYDMDGQQYVVNLDGSKDVYHGKINPKVDRVERTATEKQPTTVTELKRLLAEGKITEKEYINKLTAVPWFMGSPGEEQSDGQGQPRPTGGKPEASPKPTPKNTLTGNLVGNSIIVDGKKYTAVNGVVTINGQKYKVK